MSYHHNNHNNSLSYHPASSYYSNAPNPNNNNNSVTSIPIRSAPAHNNQNNYQNSIPRSTTHLSTFQKSFQPQQSQHHGPRTATIIPIQQSHHHQQQQQSKQAAATGAFAYNLAFQSQLQAGDHRQFQQQQQQQYTKYSTLSNKPTNNKLSMQQPQQQSSIPTFGHSNNQTLMKQQSKSTQQLLYNSATIQRPTIPLLPQNLLNTLRTLFNILDDSKSGKIHVSEIESRWDTNNNNYSNSNGENSLLNLDPNLLLSTLRSIARDSGGELDFPSFCNGVRIVLGYDSNKDRDTSTNMKNLQQRRSLDNLLDDSNHSNSNSGQSLPKQSHISKLRPPSAPTTLSESTNTTPTKPAVITVPPTGIPISPKSILIKPSNLKYPSWAQQAQTPNDKKPISKSPPTKSSNFVPYKSQPQSQSQPPPAPPKPPRNNNNPPFPASPPPAPISKIQRFNKSTNDLLDSPTNQKTHQAAISPPTNTAEPTVVVQPSKNSGSKKSSIRRYTLTSPPVDSNTIKQLRNLEEQKQGLEDIGKLLKDGENLTNIWIKNSEEGINKIIRRGEEIKSRKSKDHSSNAGAEEEMTPEASTLPQPLLSHRLSTLQSSLSSFILLLKNPSVATTPTMQSMDLILPQQQSNVQLKSSQNPNPTIDDSTHVRTIQRLQSQNRQLTLEVSNASSRIGQLEGEKMRLIKELFYKNKSSGGGIGAGDFLDMSGIGPGGNGGIGNGGVYM